jgi:hypothetical protein
MARDRNADKYGWALNLLAFEGLIARYFRSVTFFFSSYWN